MPAVWATEGAAKVIEANASETMASLMDVLFRIVENVIGISALTGV
jgi:hypothetical protein